MMLKRCGLSLITLPVFAGSMAAVQPANQLPIVVSFSIGPVWTNPGQQQNNFYDIITERTYTANRPTNVLADGEIFLGLKANLPYQFFTHFGVEGALTSQAGLSGYIWDVPNDPAFNNFIYGYHLQHSHVALKAKLFKDLSYSIVPWISASVGIGFNRSHGYDYTPILADTPKEQGPFSDHTQSSFTYTAGAGIQKLLTDHWQVGVGYEFADWGKSHLGDAPGQSVNTGLSLNHLYTNGCLFNITYTG